MGLYDSMFGGLFKGLNEGLFKTSKASVSVSGGGGGGGGDRKSVV